MKRIGISTVLTSITFFPYYFFIQGKFEVVVPFLIADRFYELQLNYDSLLLLHFELYIEPFDNMNKVWVQYKREQKKLKSVVWTGLELSMFLKKLELDMSN